MRHVLARKPCSAEVLSARTKTPQVSISPYFLRRDRCADRHDGEARLGLSTRLCAAAGARDAIESAVTVVTESVILTKQRRTGDEDQLSDEWCLVSRNRRERSSLMLAGGPERSLP